MTERYIFADEAGCFNFSREASASRYFIICTLTTSDRHKISNGLQDLRHKLILASAPVEDSFHATDDKQIIRDEVYVELVRHKFKIQATICEKSKAQPHIRTDRATFYKYPWFYHMKHGIQKAVPDETTLIITAASLGNKKKERATFVNSINSVMSQTLKRSTWAVDFRQSKTDHCLQAVDYCAWAIQRKWELGDSRSYDLIQDRITYEYELWGHGEKHYY